MAPTTPHSGKCKGVETVKRSVAAGNSERDEWVAWEISRMVKLLYMLL